jgi:hypothetical protein
MYNLSPTQDKSELFFRFDGEAAERHGAIGYLRADFGSDGYSFYFKMMFCSRLYQGKSIGLLRC